MIQKKIDYIVACYFGERRILTTSSCYNKDKIFLLKQHVNRLNELKVDNIDNIIFTINLDNLNDQYEIENKISKLESKIKINTQYHVNTGYSFLSWENVIIKRINDNITNDFFIIEDDYLPKVDYFYNYFLDLFTQYTCFVCELVFKNHPSGPNGLLRNDVCCEILKKYGRVFKINDNAKTYIEGEDNQHKFINYMIEEGYIIKDIASYLRVDRLDHKGNIVSYGNPNRESIIEPIYCLSNIII